DWQNVRYCSDRCRQNS
ncbi:MAG: DUF2256 domain-containing protein, partial [Ilumatobacteraceae bacterium]